MNDRYRYARPRSPVMYNPARASLPINVYATPSHEHHMHVVPTSRRELLQNPRSSISSISTASTGGPVTKTTYKITADSPLRGSSARDGSRSRRSTLDSTSRPTLVAAPPRHHHRPVVHTATVGRPSSPLLKNPYRSSEEEYYSVPATSEHGHHQHHKRYSATMDNADMHRLANERDGNRLRIGSGREGAGYITTRSRPVYTGSAVRHADTVSADYGDNGYGYTNPRDLVQYDLNNAGPPPRHHSRRDSFEGGRPPRSNSITGYNDAAVQRPYDTRERGPPPTTRGFDRITPRGSTWEQGQVRMPAVPPPPPMDPIQRPPRVDAPFEDEPIRRKESIPRRPVTLYHDREPRRVSQREEYYEVRDEDPRDRRDRPQRHERYEDPVEQRGFGIRPERAERDRGDRAEDFRSDHKEHKGGKEALAAGVGLAGAAFGANALKNSGRENREERDDREESRRRKEHDDYDEEPRRRRSPRDEREPVDLSDRNPRERRHRDSDLPPPPPGPPPGYERDTRPETPVVDLSGRDPKERHNSRDERPRDERVRDERSKDERPRDERSRDERVRDERSKDERPRDERPRDERPREDRERDSEPDRRDRDRDRERNRERRRHRSEATVAGAAIAGTAAAAALAGTAIDSREDSSASEDARLRSRREPRSRHGSEAAPAPFNPKDTMDLKALKQALNQKEAVPSKEPVLSQRAPRESMSKDARELADIRTDLNSSSPRGREPSLPPNKDSRQLRVVSPPREKVEDKPVKGILRQPREKFPEDPSPIREGVAPLKDAKKDGVPPDARWTKISRKLVNPEALEAGKERFEAREDFVIVLRVLTRDEVQGYAVVTERIRAAREELERQDRRRSRRERHERHKREGRGERRRSSRKERGSDEEESDTTDSYDDRDERPKMLEGVKPVMSGGLGDAALPQSSLRETDIPGQYTGYLRNPPQQAIPSVAATVGSGSRKESKS